MSALKFLVVDDASFIREMLKKNLRDNFPGCEVSDCPSAKNAMVALKSKRFDLILCDWEMPEMSGEEFLRWVRASEQYAEMPFIMVTSRGERDFIVKAAQTGVSDYVGKPFTPEILVKKVSKVLNKAGIKINAPKSPSGQQGAAGSSADLLTGSTPQVQPKAKPAPSSAGGDSASLLRV